MSSIAKIASGTLLKMGDGASPEVFTTMPEVTRLSGPSVRFDLLDVTSHDTVGYFREYIPGLSDGDKITATVNWRPSNTIHKNLRIDAYARTNRNFKIVFPDTSDNTVACSTYVESQLPKADVGTVLAMDISLKVTGQPTWS